MFRLIYERIISWFRFSFTYIKYDKNGSRYTESDDIAIIILRKEGLTYREIGVHLGRSSSGIYSRYKLLQEKYNRELEECKQLVKDIENV